MRGRGGRDRPAAGRRRTARAGCRDRGRQAGPQGRPRRHPWRARRGPAFPGGGRQRPRGGGRLRWRPVSRTARRLGPAPHSRVLQRRRGHRRLEAGVLHRHAHRGPGPGAPGQPGADRRRTCRRRGVTMTTSPTVSVADLTDIRVREPQRIAQAWATSPRRPVVGDDGRLLRVAADHPARGALGVRADTGAMASRSELLGRLATAVSRPGVDGVLGTPDILDDLLLLGALEGKVVIGSMNRGGLQGAVFELDDRFTAYRARDLAANGLDGGKMLTRIALGDPGTVSTLEASAQAITELAELGLMAMVEPFLSERREGRVVNLLDPESTIKSIHIAAGLGASSAHTWLKLPVVDDLARVMDATTLPTLLLGGDPQGDPQDTYASWGHALDLPAVRGLVVGRALLFPPDGDVAAAVDIAAGLVHGSANGSGVGA